MHALQLLPLLAAGLAAVGRHRLDDLARTRIVQVAGAAYAAVVLLVIWQALRAQPLLAPDALTLAALAVVLAGCGATLAAVLRAAARRRPPARSGTHPTPPSASEPGGHRWTRSSSSRSRSRWRRRSGR